VAGWRAGSRICRSRVWCRGRLIFSGCRRAWLADDRPAQPGSSRHHGRRHLPRRPE
jgi:hypothetical protein